MDTRTDGVPHELTGRQASALGKALQHNPDYAIYLLDASGTIETWNAAAERIKGYPAQEAIGKHFRIFFPGEDIASHKPEFVLKVAQSAGAYEEQGWRLRKGGAPFWAHIHLTPRFDDEGQLLGFVKITQDITARKQAEDALRASEERYHSLVDSVKDYAIFLLDPHGRVRTWNTGAQRIKGYTPAEIIGESIARFYTPEERERGRPQQLLARAAKEGRVEDEGWRVRKDGTRFWADVVISPIEGPDGRLLGFSKVTRDLTERRSGQHERASLGEQVAATSEANRRLEAFTYSVAHDLRAPIRTIASLADILAAEHSAPLDAEAREILQRICRTSEKMGALVEDLLNFSRADKGEIRQEKVDIGKLAHHIHQNALLKADPSRVGELVLAQDLTVWGDPALLRIVMDNILGNAWKFTSGRPRYRIEVRKTTGDHVDTVSVKDNGVGFPSDRADVIFQPFRRLHDPASFPGSGVGLATVERIIQRHGGRVWAESEPESGATIYFSLPQAGRASGPSG